MTPENRENRIKIATIVIPSKVEDLAYHILRAFIGQITYFRAGSYIGRRLNRNVYYGSPNKHSQCKGKSDSHSNDSRLQHRHMNNRFDHTMIPE